MTSNPPCEHTIHRYGRTIRCELLAGHVGDWHISADCSWRTAPDGEISRACPHCGRDVA